MAAKRFKMRLSSVGNPDFGQYAPLSPARVVRADTLKEMRAACEAYIEEFDLGGGNWIEPIVYDGDLVVGKFSYNRRLWKGLGRGIESREEILL